MLEVQLAVARVREAATCVRDVSGAEELAALAAPGAATRTSASTPTWSR